MIVQCAECKTSFRLNDELVPPRSIKVRCARCGHVFAMDGREVDRKTTVETATPVAPALAPSPTRFGDLELESTPVAPPRTTAPLPEGNSPSTRSAQRGESPVAQAAPLPPAAASSPAAPVAEASPQATPPARPPAAPVAEASPQATPPARPPAASQTTRLADAAPKPAAALSSSSPAAAGPGDLQLERSEPLLGTSPAATVDAAVAVEAPPAPAPESFPTLDLDASAKVAEPAPAPAEAVPQQKRQDDKARRLARALVSDILVYNREKRDKALQGGNLVQVLAGEIKKSWEVYKERVTPEVANSTNHFREALNDILADGQQIF